MGLTTDEDMILGMIHMEYPVFHSQPTSKERVELMKGFDNKDGNLKILIIVDDNDSPGVRQI